MGRNREALARVNRFSMPQSIHRFGKDTIKFSISRVDLNWRRFHRRKFVASIIFVLIMILALIEKSHNRSE